MNILKKLTSFCYKVKRSEKIAAHREKWFRHFLGINTKGYEDEYPEKYPKGWRGNTPEEAMELADKVVTWLYSPIK